MTNDPIRATGEAMPTNWIRNEVSVHRKNLAELSDAITRGDATALWFAYDQIAAFAMTASSWRIRNWCLGVIAGSNWNPHRRPA